MNSIKTLNTVIWGTCALWNWGRWLIAGSPETPELTLAKQNKQRMDRMEDKLDQILAIELGLPQVEIGNSFIVIEPNEKEEFNSFKTTRGGSDLM